MTVKRITDELKSDIKKCVRKEMGDEYREVRDIVIRCMEKKYDKKKVISRLPDISKSKATRIVDKIFRLYDDHKSKDDHLAKNVKRESKTEEIRKVKVEECISESKSSIQIDGDHSSKKRKYESNVEEESEKKKIKIEKTVNETKSSDQLDPEIYLKMAQEIKRTMMPNLSITNVTNQSTNLNSQTKNISNQASLAVPATETTMVIPNSVGLDITLFANITKEKEKLEKLTNKSKIKDPKTEEEVNKFFDPNIRMKANERHKKELKWVEEGTVSAMANLERKKAQYRIKEAEIAEASKKTGISAAVAISSIQPAHIPNDIVPEVEWWDIDILSVREYPKPSDLLPDQSLPINTKQITNNVFNPRIEKEITKNVELITMMTKKECKRLRKLRREEKNKQTQENIKLGLEPPPEPKLRLANLNRVLCSDMVSDPTKTENYVKAQVAKRLKAHEDANEARKLTKEQRKEKKDKKIREDTTSKVEVGVYRVKTLSHKNTFKVKKTANDLHMTGIVVKHNDCIVIVVEGGPKQQRKFKRLMMIRIKWNNEMEDGDSSDDDDNDDDECEKNDKNGCECVWEGEVKSRAFGEMEVKTCPTAFYASNVFKQHSVEHYWDSAYGTYIIDKVPQTI